MSDLDAQVQPGPRRSRRITVPLAIMATLTAFATPILVAEPASAAGPLRTHAAARGKFIGFAAANTPLAGETAYRNIAGTEFNQVTAENAMKWDATENADNNYTFGNADAIVAFAQANNQTVHGHTLVWHSQTPGWVQGLGATAMRTAMQDHIATVVGRYAANPAVVSWDVVNEVFDDSGNMRTSFWYNTLGQSYIADAFTYARAADPDARLCINDYNVEGINAKSTAMYNLVQSLRAQNVPVDCVGFQGHLATQYGFPSQVQQNIQRFADLGVQVRITELDVRVQTPRSAAKDATQATYYASVVNACLAVTACAGITVWGFTDKYSWVPSTFPSEGAALIYDENYAAKPAYTAVHDALAGGAPADTTAPTAPANLTASGTTATSTNLSWTAATDNTGVTGYDILRAPGTTGGTFTTIGTSTTTTFTNTGLTPATTYRYQTRARDAAGNTSTPSNTTTITTTGGSNGGCSATGTTQTTWNNGYVIQPLTITNTNTTTITGWTITAKSISWNATLNPGTSTAIGFQASRPNGDTNIPTGYTCTSP